MRQRSGSHLSPRRESSVSRLVDASRFDTLKRRSVVDVGDKPFPFALLPKAAKARLARHMDLIDLSRVRAVSAWHKEFADRHLPSVRRRRRRCRVDQRSCGAQCWADRLEHSYPLLAMTIRLRRRAAAKQGERNTHTHTPH